MNLDLSQIIKFGYLDEVKVVVYLQLLGFVEKKHSCPKLVDVPTLTIPSIPRPVCRRPQVEREVGNISKMSGIPQGSLLLVVCLVGWGGRGVETHFLYKHC